MVSNCPRHVLPYETPRRNRLGAGADLKGPGAGSSPCQPPEMAGLGPPSPGCKGAWGPTGAAAGWRGREAPSLNKEGLCSGEILVAAGRGGRGERCAGESTEFSAFPLKAQSSFLLLDIYLPQAFSSLHLVSLPAK